MKIDFLIAHNPYETTTHFSLHFGKALSRLGWEVRYFDIHDGCFYKAFYHILNDPPDLTCSFSDITIGKKEPLGDAWRIPHLSILVDHAIYFLHQLSGKYSLISTIDQEDLIFLKKLNFDKAFFLPHAVPQEMFAAKREEKSYDIVMLGSCIDIEAIASSWKKRHSSQEFEFLMESSNEVLRKDISCLEALLKGNFDENLLPKLHQEMENFVKGKERIELVRSLKNVHVWGRGKWKKYVPECIHHSAISFEKALLIMGRAKIVLNSCPTLKYSFHERLFYTLALNSLPLTSDVPLIKETFPHLPFYRLAESIQEQVSHLIDNESFMKELIETAKELVKENHTWDERAKALQNEIRRLLSLSADISEDATCTQSRLLSLC